MITKKCIKCLSDKPISDYHVCNRSKDGRHSKCKECESERKKKFYLKNKDKINKRNKTWKINNPDKVKNQHVNYYNNNKDVLKIKHKLYNELNKDKLKSYHKKYRKINKDRIANKHKERLKNDELFRLTCLMRVVIRTNLKKLSGGKYVKTTKLLGCDFNYLKTYIENQWFLPCNLNENGEVWMNWSNHGLYNGQRYYGWDIDHIVPLIPSTRTKDELLELFKFTNLQPLCSYINRVVKKDILDF
jgi:hypothetical protein